MSDCKDCDDKILNPKQHPQAFCEECGEDKCAVKLDAECVIYHLDGSKPNKLQNIGGQNGFSASQLFELLDDLIGNGGNISLDATDSPSINLTGSGPANHKLKGDVNISKQANNHLSLKNDGLYVGLDTTGIGKVKVNATDTLDYLENQIIGGTDSIISISVSETTGLLQILPSLDIACLLNEIKNNTTLRNLFCQIVAMCGGASSSNPILPIVQALCSSASYNSNVMLGTPQIVNITIPVVVTYSGNVTFTLSSTNFNGNVTVNVSPLTTSVVVPVQYNGLGSVGTENLTLTMTGTQNTSPCLIAMSIQTSTINKYITIKNLMTSTSKEVSLVNINSNTVISVGLAGGSQGMVDVTGILSNPNVLSADFTGISTGTNIIFKHVRGNTILFTSTVTYGGSLTTFASLLDIQDGDILEFSELSIINGSISHSIYTGGANPCSGQHIAQFTFNFNAPTTEEVTIRMATCNKGQGTQGNNTCISGCDGVTSQLGGTMPNGYVETSDRTWKVVIPAGTTSYTTSSSLRDEQTNTWFMTDYPDCHPFHSCKIGHLYIKSTTISNTQVNFTMNIPHITLTQL